MVVTRLMAPTVRQLILAHLAFDGSEQPSHSKIPIWTKQPVKQIGVVTDLGIERLGGRLAAMGMHSEHVDRKITQPILDRHDPCGAQGIPKLRHAICLPHHAVLPGLYNGAVAASARAAATSCCNSTDSRPSCS
jgi:hypothetical protein